jgi:hypothetical protein
MAVNFPNSPTNGQTVTVDGVTYSWNAAGSVWDMVTTATATVAVTAPVVNTGTSTAAVLGIKASPIFSGDGTNNIVEFKKSNGVTRTYLSQNGSDLYVGGNTAESGSVQIGHGATGNQYAYVDMVGDTTYSDFGARLIRDNGGPNTNTALIHRGTGALIVSALDAGGIQFRTADAIRMKIEPNGDSIMSGNLIGKTGTGGTVANQNGSGSFEARGDGSNAASMSFHRPGNYAINMGLDTDNSFKIGGWSQGGTPYFQMNTSGHMILPSQPTINGSCTNTAGAGGFANSFSTLTNIGFTIGSDRITVPTAGNYLITFNTISNLSTGRQDAQIAVNGANPVSILTEDNGTGYHGRSISIVRTLAGNDYIQFANTNWYVNTSTGYVEWRTFSITKLS